MTLDIPNAFIQADMPEQEVGKRVVIKLRGRLVDWLVQLDPTSYESKVVYERGVNVLYLLVMFHVQQFFYVSFTALPVLI